MDDAPTAATSGEVDELVLLRRHYGLSAREAWCDVPAWEVELMLQAIPEGGGGE